MVAALIVGPLIVYCFGLVFHQAILFAFPLAAVPLIALSYAFGLWSERVEPIVKVASVLWSVVIAWLSPIILILAFCYAGALLKIPDSCI